MHATASAATFDSVCVEPIGGVAGDMLLAALIDLGASRDAIHDAFESLGDARLRLRLSPVDVAGQRALHVASVAPRSLSASSGDHCRHVHLGDHSGHVHLGDIMRRIDGACMPDGAKRSARAIFTLLADAEARVHGGASDDVHLHEVGELDSILDVVGIAVALESLGAPQLRATPLPSGHGQVHTAHGWLDCPVPAVMQMVRRFDIPLVPVDIDGETVTPTGVAVLAALGTQWVAAPPKDWQRCGIGAGNKRFATRPNIVRVWGRERDEGVA